MNITCPKCKTKSTAPVNAAGRNVKCPKCGVALAVPSSAANAPAPPAVTTKSIPVAPSTGPAKGNPAPQRTAPIAMARAAWDRLTLVHLLGIASLGCLTAALGLTPCVGMFALPLAGLGLMMGIGGTVVSTVRKGSGIGLPVAGTGVNGLALVIGAMWALLAAGISTTAENAGEGNFSQEKATQVSQEAKADSAIANKVTEKKPATDPPIVKKEPDNTKDAEALFKMAKAAQEKADAAEKRATERLAKAEELEKENDLDRRKIAGDMAKAEKEIDKNRQELAALKQEIEAAKQAAIASRKLDAIKPSSNLPLATRDNFAKLSTGMPRETVEGILGKADERFDSEDFIGLTWRNGELRITVSIRRGTIVMGVPMGGGLVEKSISK